MRSFHLVFVNESGCDKRVGYRRTGWSPLDLTPDFNPIEEFFAELKAHIKKYWSTYEEDCDRGFHAFLRRCVQDVGAKNESAGGHFWHAGITVEEHE